MLINMHAHIKAGKAKESSKPLNLIRERYGVEHIIISALKTFDPAEDEIRQLNDAAYECMQEDPDHISALCYINPRNSNSLEELEYNLDRGMVGVKLWTAAYCNDPLVYPIAEECIEKNKPILIHTFNKSVEQLPCESRAEHVADLARRYPELIIVMAHMGAAAFQEIPVIKRLINVYVDFSGSVNRADDLPYALEALGSKRIMFGSDEPVGFHPSYGQLMDAKLTQEEFDDIAWRNADKVFLGGRYAKI